MLRVFLATHAHLASGMRSSLELLAGSMPGLVTCDAYVDGVDDVRREVEEFFRMVGPDDQVLLVSDLYGGSVNTALCQFAGRPRTRLVAGANLAFLLELSTMEGQLSDADLERLVELSREGLRVVDVSVDEGTDASSPVDCSDDFFA